MATQILTCISTSLSSKLPWHTKRVVTTYGTSNGWGQSINIWAMASDGVKSGDWRQIYNISSMAGGKVAAHVDSVSVVPALACFLLWWSRQLRHRILPGLHPALADGLLS
ncbi:hypothetical protein M758_11G098900 [Ceratodon purpureus]|nr:hypothetical protein M758_11G098900 [Ceratodon purpureus]